MRLVRARIEISDISAIYQISAFIEAIFATENRLEEKSEKIRKYQRNIVEISVTDRNIGRHIGDWGHARVGKNYWIFLGDISEISVKYRRYIGNIGKNIEDISRYIGDISGYIGIYRKYIQITRFEILT